MALLKVWEANHRTAGHSLSTALFSAFSQPGLTPPSSQNGWKRVGTRKVFSSVENLGLVYWFKQN